LETASAIQVITADDIRRAGATSGARALRLASNLQVHSRLGSWAISARDSTAERQQVAVLIDGRWCTRRCTRPVWEVQDTLLEDIDRLKSSVGLARRCGCQPVNGVINIITKTAADTQGMLVTAAAFGVQGLAVPLTRHDR